jgi:hypothetical protein
MGKFNPKQLLATAGNYLKANPDELLRAAKGALGLRLGIPLDALRYFARQMGGNKKAPQDIVIEAAGSGLRLAATVRAMGSTLRARLTLHVEQLNLSPSELLVTARIVDLDVEVLDGDDTPVAGLIKSGALDLSKPGNLVAYMPKRPAALVDAKDDMVVVDLMKIEKVAADARLNKALSVITPVLNIASVQTRDDHLDVHLKASPSGLGDAISAATA